MSQAQHVNPDIDHWYDSGNFPECFKVVAYDEAQHLIEIQYFDGEIAELDEEAWFALHPHEIAEPEDAEAPYEVDREYTEQDLNNFMKGLDSDDSDWD